MWTLWRSVRYKRWNKKSSNEKTCNINFITYFECRMNFDLIAWLVYRKYLVNNYYKALISCKKLVGWGQFLRKTSNNIPLRKLQKNSVLFGWNTVQQLRILSIFSICEMMKKHNVSCAAFILLGYFQPCFARSVSSLNERSFESICRFIMSTHVVLWECNNDD